MSADAHSAALDQLAADDWDAAHRIIQEESDRLACLIHGLLHRIEGDESNAAYWYRQAGEDLPSGTIDDEVRRLRSMAGNDA